MLDIATKTCAVVIVDETRDTVQRDIGEQDLLHTALLWHGLLTIGIRTSHYPLVGLSCGTVAISAALTSACVPLLGTSELMTSFPLDRRRRLAADVVDHAVDARNAVDDARRDPGQQVVG